MVRRLTAGSLLLCLLLSGCARLPRGEDMTHLKLINTLTIFAEPEGTVTLSGSTPLQSDSGGETKPPEILTTRGASIAEAAAALSRQTSGQGELDHLSYCLISEETARNALRPTADYLQQDLSIRLETRLLLLLAPEGESALRGCAGKNSSIGDQLRQITKDSKRDTLRCMLRDLEDNGCCLLPVVQLMDREGGEENDARQQVFISRLAFCREEGLAGILNEAETLGVRLFYGEMDQAVFTVTLPGGDRAAVSMTACSPKLIPHWSPQGELTRLSLQLKAEGELCQWKGEEAGEKEGSIRQLEESWAQQLSRPVRAVLNRCRQESMDLLHLRSRALSPRKGKEPFLLRVWVPGEMPAVPIEVQVTCTVKDG